MSDKKTRGVSLALCILAGLTLPTVSALNAQESSDRAAFSLTRVGIGFGFHDLYTAPYLREILDYAGFADVALRKQTVLRLQSLYSQSKGIDHADRYSLKSVALDAVILTKVSKLSSLGIGLGVNWMKFRRHSVVTVRDNMQDAPSYTEALDLSDELLSPSLLLMASSGWVSIGSAGFELALTYQWTYLGKSFVNRSRYNLSSGPLYSMISCGATAFMSFDFME